MVQLIRDSFSHTHADLCAHAPILSLCQHTHTPTLEYYNPIFTRLPNQTHPYTRPHPPTHTHKQTHAHRNKYPPTYTDIHTREFKVANLLNCSDSSFNIHRHTDTHKDTQTHTQTQLLFLREITGFCFP